MLVASIITMTDSSQILVNFTIAFIALFRSTKVLIIQLLGSRLCQSAQLHQVSNCADAFRREAKLRNYYKNDTIYCQELKREKQRARKK